MPATDEGHPAAKSDRATRRSAADLCREALDRIAAANSRLNAFVQAFPERAMERAADIDRRAAGGEPVGVLAGAPIAVKDNICTSFGFTTCGSNSLEGYRSPYNATAIERIEAAGGVIVGKTNLDEFAMGSSTETSARGPVRNPWDRERVAGGSSGGSAAAVAAELTPLALGSDTGGSVRQPAAFCGVVGIKPTYGRVSRYGLVAYGSSLDQIGTLARDVRGAAALLEVIAGHDPRDGTSVPRDGSDLARSASDEAADALRGRLRIGVAREHFGDGLDGEVADAVREALRVYGDAGATVVDVSLPNSRYSIAAYYVIATAECSSNLARFDGVHYGRRAGDGGDIIELTKRSRTEGFGPEVKRRIMLGTFALSSGYYDAYYGQAQRVRGLVRRDYEDAFRACDLLISPTTPTPAFRLGEKLSDPLQMYLADVYTVGANLAGIPAISIPCGFSRAGLPIGLQLTGPAFGEATLISAARLYERAVGWNSRRPAEF